MFDIDGKLQKVLLFYLSVNALVYYYKPSFCFDEKGNFKDFGVGDKKTIVPFFGLRGGRHTSTTDVLWSSSSSTNQIT